MTLRLNTITRDLLANAAGDSLDVAGATLRIRSGAGPVDPNAAATGTLLATFTLPGPVFGEASAGVVTAVAISDATAVATGTAGHYRVADQAGNDVWQGTVTATGGGGELQLDTVAITTGNILSITAWTITMPESAA